MTPAERVLKALEPQPFANIRYSGLSYATYNVGRGVCAHDLQY